MVKTDRNPIVFILVSEDLRLDSVSPENLQIISTGLGWEIEPGMYLPDLLQGEVKEYFIEQVKDGFSGRCFSFEILFPCNRNQVKECEVVVTPSQMDQGKVTKVGLAIRCKDGFKENLAKLYSDGLMSIVFNSVSLGICITDRQGKFVEVNQEYCRIYGYSREELIGNSYTMVVDPKNHEYFQKLYDDFFVIGEEEPGEFEVITKSGKPRMVSVVADKLTSPEGEEFRVTTVNDITELKLLENQVESMTRNIPGIVLRYMVMPDGSDKLLYVSEGLFEFCGISPKEAVEDVNLIWSRIDSEFVHGMKESVRISAETLQTWEYQWKFLHTDGTIHWHRAKGNLKRLSDGSIIWDSIILDVTQEKNAERALEESETRFEKLISEGVEMISILNAEGKYLYNSHSYQAILGFDPAELYGFQAFSLIHPDDVPQLFSEFQQVFTSKKIQSQPYRIRRKDGQYIWLRSTGTNLLDDPLIQGIVVNSTDITDLIQVEKDLKSSEKQYKYLFENNPGAMMIWDLENGQILDVNERTCQLYGYSHSEFLKLTVYDIRPKKEVSKFIEQSKTENWLNDSGTRLYYGISRHLKKSGEALDIEVNAQMIDYKGKRVSLVLLYDVTEKLKAETEVSISEEKYRSVFNLSPLPKMIYRRDTLRFLDVNELAIKNYGYTKEEFLTLTPLDIRPENQKEIFLKFQQEEIPFGKVFNFGINIHQKKDQSLIYVEITGQRIIYQGIDAMMIVAIDVTEKVLANKLEKLELELMEEVILVDSGLEDQLSKFLLGLEGAVPRIRTSVLRVENDKLYNLVSPTISTTYMEEIQGLPIGPDVGSCGAAAYLGQRRSTEDISKDPNWEGLKKLALDQGFRSTLSFPIFNPDKKVIATFGVYFLDYKKPDSSDFERFQRAASLISLILEHHTNKVELRLSNERYEYVNLATKDAIYDWDIEKNKLYWGKSYERFLGIEHSDKEFVLEDWRDRIHPADLNRLTLTLENDLGNPAKERFKEEYHIRKNDGTYAFVVDRSMIVRDDKGKAIRMVGVLSDVTHQRMEELRLKLLESVITNANDAVIITEAEPFSMPGPRIVYVNEAFTRMTGYSAEEVLGKSPRILQGVKTSQKELDILRESMKNWQSCEITTVNYKKSGEEFWSNFSISPVADANGWYTHWISIQRDVTAQKIEEQKKELLARIVQIFGEEERFNFALDRSLEQLLRFSDIDAGEIWLVNSDKSKLNQVSRYALTDAGSRFFSMSDKNTSFKKGESLPGQIWESNQYKIIDEFSDLSLYRRKDAALNAGFKSAFGFPFHDKNEVIGVAVFVSSSSNWVVQSALEIFSSMSQVLGAEIHRKKVQDELSQIFDTAQDIICIMGFDGKFKKVNRGAVILLGYTEEELLSHRYDYFIHPADRQESEIELKNMVEGQNLIHFVNRFITKDGEVVWLDWNSTVVAEEELIYSVAKDITEEKELQNLLESANQMARIGFWDVDTLGGTQYWSSVTKEIFEVDPDFTPSVEKGIRYYTEGAIPVISEYFNRCAQTGEPYDLELPIITEKGKNLWIRTQGQAEFREGTCIRVYGSIQDITDLKTVQIELEKSFEQKNAILESIGDAFFSLDKQGLITYWNHEASKLFGGAKEEMVGKSIWDLFPLTSENITLEKLREAAESGRVLQFEEFFEIYDRWLEISIYPSEIGLSVYLKDITIRKTTEELIRQSNERFENAAKATRDAIWDYDIRSGQLYWGEGFRTLFGYELNSGNQQYDDWASKIHPEDKDRVVGNATNLFANPSVANIQNEYRFLKSDSTYAYVIDRGMIIRDSNGEALRVVGAISDVTERKEFESSLRSLNEKLELRAKELAASNAELEQFAYVASHDLQEPLRMVSSFLSQLEIKYKDQLDERAQKYIYFAVDGAMRMRQIILDLLEFSRVGRMDGEEEQVDLTEIVEEVCTLQSSLIQSKDAKISWVNLPVIKGFRTPMLQVFQNLISNAIKYSREEAVPDVRISCSEAPGYWEFSVEDNGIGMEEDSFDKIFVIFQRLHTKDQYAGNGIGLAIVKKIVENLGGKICVQSTPGVGTIFRFTIKK